jgi:hypothetical protein
VFFATAWRGNGMRWSGYSPLIRRSSKLPIQLKNR